MTQTIGSFFRRILGRLGASSGPAQRGVRLAAFGKHPGWDDHVELGLDSDRLVGIRRILYVEGIGGHVESGAWDRLPAEARLARFDHLFIWETSQAVQVGRLWASSDGKGRTRYPMVVCADCTAVPIGEAAGACLPVLEQIQRRCAATTSAEGVREAIDWAAGELQAGLLADDRPDPLATSEIDGPVARVAACCAEGAADGAGEAGEAKSRLMKLLYHLGRDAGPDAPLGRPEALGRFILDHPVHLRVPSCSNAEESAIAWIRFLRTQLEGSVPILAIAPLGERWLDLVAGRPAPSHLFGIMARPAAVPLTTDIPYNLDERFIARASQFLESSR